MSSQHLGWHGKSNQLKVITYEYKLFYIPNTSLVIVFEMQSCKMFVIHIWEVIMIDWDQKWEARSIVLAFEGIIEKVSSPFPLELWIYYISI